MAAPTFADLYAKAQKARAMQTPEAQRDYQVMAQYLAETFPQQFDAAERAAHLERMQRANMAQQVSEMGPFDRFVNSAGYQVNKMLEGGKDLLGIGDPRQRQAQMRQADMFNEAMYDQAPATALAGNVAGGVAAAAPIAALTPELGGTGLLALGARALVGGAAGAIESGIEYPSEGETRAGNMAFGAATGVGAEFLGTALRNVWSKWKSRGDGMLDANGPRGTIETALRAEGLRIEDLKPETQAYLQSLRRDTNVDDAINGALETEFGFKLTRGEATRDFTQLSDESTAARTSGKASDDMRAFKVEQNRGILDAADTIARDAGGATGNAEATGASIKSALDRVRAGDEGAYRSLYTSVRERARESGVDIQVPGTQVEQTFRELVQDHGSEYEGLLNDIGRRLSDYGITDPEKFKRSTLLEATDIERAPLNITNQPDLIRYLNSLYNDDPVRQRILRRLKESLEVSADETVEGLMSVDDGTLRMMGLEPAKAKEFIANARKAREAFKDYKSLWENSDIIEQLVGTKGGSSTPMVDPSAVVRKVTSSPENVRRVIDLLSERGDMQAVADLRTFVLKDLFDQSINVNNVDTAGEAVFSGTKLSSLIKKNASSLEALLSPEQMAKLRAFEAQVGKATKRPEGTVNYSNTGYKLMDFLFNVLGLKIVPVLSAVPEVAARSTMRGALNNTPRTATDMNVAMEALRLGDKNKNLNMVLRQAIQASGPLFEDEEEQPRGILQE